MSSAFSEIQHSDKFLREKQQILIFCVDAYLFCCIIYNVASEQHRKHQQFKGERIMDYDVDMYYEDRYALIDEDYYCDEGNYCDEEEYDEYDD